MLKVDVLDGAGVYRNDRHFEEQHENQYSVMIVTTHANRTSNTANDTPLDPVHPDVQTLATSPVPLIVPARILHRQHPRNRIAILERLPFLPHPIPQLNALRNSHILTLLCARIIVAHLDEAVQTRARRYVEHLSHELSPRRQPGTYIAFDLDEQRVLAGFDVRHAGWYAAGDLGHVLLLGLRGRAAVAVDCDGCWPVAR